MTRQEFTDWMKSLSPVLSGQSQGAASGLLDEAQLINQQNQGATSRYQALVNAGRLQNVEQPNANLDQGTRGAVLSSWQPVVVGQSSVPYGSTTSGPVRSGITGGASVTPELRQLGAQVTRDALSRQMAGNPLATNVFPSDAQLGMTPLPKASWLDKALGYGAEATSILGAMPKFGGAAKAGGAAGGASGSNAAGLMSKGNPGYYFGPEGAGLAGGGVSPVGANGIPLGGTVLPPETMPPTTGGGVSFSGMGGGTGSLPSSATWFTPLDNAKLQQNNSGSAQSYLPNPFSDYGSSGVPDTLTWLLQNGNRSYKR